MRGLQELTAHFDTLVGGLVESEALEHRATGRQKRLRRMASQAKGVREFIARTRPDLEAMGKDLIQRQPWNQWRESLPDPDRGARRLADRRRKQL